MAHDEFSLIRYLTENQAHSPKALATVRVGIGDDAAVLDGSGEAPFVITCDTMVEHVHFLVRDWNASFVGYKALAGTLSDLAAMGATPRCVTIALAVPRDFDVTWLRKMYEGIYECAANYEVAVVGGDTVATTGALTVSATAVGVMAAGYRPLLRSAAQPGDILFVSGYPGLSSAGLHQFLASDFSFPAAQTAYPTLFAAHHRPKPQLGAGQMFAASGLVHALNDISDGVAGESWEIAVASNAQLLVRAVDFPIHPELRAYAQATGCDPLDWVLYGGEDYQLLGTVAASDWPALQATSRAQGIFLHAIGEVLAQTSSAGERMAADVLIEWSSGERQRLAKKSYNHFPTERGDGR